MRDEVSVNITKHIIDKLNSPVEDSQKQIEKYTETILQRLSERKKQLECQKAQVGQRIPFAHQRRARSRSMFSAAG
jgi:hypothetical protein